MWAPQNANAPQTQPNPNLLLLFLPLLLPLLLFDLPPPGYPPRDSCLRTHASRTQVPDTRARRPCSKRSDSKAKQKRQKQKHSESRSSTATVPLSACFHPADLSLSLSLSKVSHRREGFKVPGLWLLILPPQAQPQATIAGKPSTGPKMWQRKLTSDCGKANQYIVPNAKCNPKKNTIVVIINNM
jgi:hypothetical protein